MYVCVYILCTEKYLLQVKDGIEPVPVFLNQGAVYVVILFSQSPLKDSFAEIYKVLQTEFTVK